MTRPSIRQVSAVLAVATFLSAACGGDEAAPASSDAASQAPATSTGAPEPVEPATEAPTTTAPPTTTTLPESPPPSEREIVSAGDWHSCGVRVDGTVTCWGSNEFLFFDEADNSGWDYAGNLDVPPGQFLSVSAGALHTCGLRPGLTVSCWGVDHSGESDPPPGQFRAVSAGRSHSCGLRTERTIACWGVS